jgi:sulfatase modifying factor 1
MLKGIVSLTAAVTVCVCAVAASANVVIDTVTVGNPGNTGELSGLIGPDRISGAVDYTYNIGKYEVTAGQYTEFLNAVAATDTYGLYNTEMSSDIFGCKIERSGSSGNYTYSVASDRANRPVNYVSYWDSCRFANWLHNGQPTGNQGAGTTETGAYTLDGYNGADGREIQRNPDWNWAVTSEDEWHKAAYHKNDGATGNYFEYSTSSDILPSNDLIDPDPGNNATFYESGYTIGSPYWRTEVGAHENSLSPYGTLDQGGNVSEWNESVVQVGRDFAFRGVRGGSFISFDNFYLAAATRDFGNPTSEVSNTGFRLSQVPEPATIVILGLASLGIMRRR